MRNIYIDLNELLGCDFRCAALVQTNVGEKEGPHDPHYVLHVLAEDNDVATTFTDANKCAYEYVDDLPAKMKNKDGSPKHTFLGIPVHKNQERRLTVAEPEE